MSGTHEHLAGQQIAAQSVYVEGFRLGKNMTNGQTGIMFIVSGDPEKLEEEVEPCFELPVVCFDEEGLLLLYNALGRMLGLKQT